MRYSRNFVENLNLIVADICFMVRLCYALHYNMVLFVSASKFLFVFAFLCRFCLVFVCCDCFTLVVGKLICIINVCISICVCLFVCVCACVHEHNSHSHNANITRVTSQTCKTLLTMH